MTFNVTYPGRICILRSVLDDMEEWASKNVGIERGGMLFGDINSELDPPHIIIEKVINVSNKYCSSSSSHFEINMDYAVKTLQENKKKYDYIGNWHSHLGFFGPSHGDIHQVRTFFSNNHRRNTLVTFIMALSNNPKSKFSPIVEVYRRNPNQHDGFDTFSADIIVVRKRNSNRIYNSQSYARSLIPILEKKFAGYIDPRPINLEKGLNESEYIITIPLRYTDIPRIYEVPYIDPEVRPKIDVNLKISVPPEYPRGKLFLDIASNDMTKQLTINKYPVFYINDRKELTEFIKYIKHLIKEYIPDILMQPLRIILTDKKLLK